MSDGIAAAPSTSTVDTSPVSESPDVDTSSDDSDSTETRPEPKVQAPKRDSDDGDDKEVDSKPKQSGEKKEPESKKAAEPKKETEEDILKKTIKRKVNGKEVEMTVAEALRKAELVSGAEEKFQEAAKMRKEVEAFVQALKEKPLHVLKQMGIDVRGNAEEYLAEEVQLELMSPEERELYELRKWKQEQEQARQQEEMTAQQRAQQQQEMAARQQAQQFYDKKISEVLSQSNLPKTPYTVKRVATLLKTALSKGYELPIETAVDMVRGDFANDLRSMSSGDPAQIIKLLGDDIVKMLRKHDLEQIKAKRKPAATPAEIAEQNLQPRQRTEKTTEKMSMDEWKEYIRKRAGV